MAPTKVYLIGENHFDLRKIERYQRAFAQLSPDVVTLERDPASLQKIVDAFAATEEKSVIPEQGREILKSFFVGSYFAAVGYEEQTGPLSIKAIDPLAAQAYKKLKNDLTEKPEDRWEAFFAQPSLGEYISQIAFGKNRYAAVHEADHSFADRNQAVLLRLAEQGDAAEITSTQRLLDCFYPFLEEEPLTEVDKQAALLEERDAHVGTEILRQEGVVVHAAGYFHVFGAYHNLYDRLQEAGASVERFDLLSFHSDKELENFAYRAAIRAGLAVIKHQMKRSGYSK